MERRSIIDWEPLRVALSGVTFSVREVSKMYHCRDEKVHEKLGTELRCEQKVAGGRVAINAMDVLKPIIEQCVMLARC